jgi:O-antigen ligase
VIVRFTDTDPTGRDLLVEVDYQVFREHPIWGAGVGQSLYYHIPVFGYKKNTHTEYSRLLAEHGIFGIGVIALMFGVLLSHVLSRRSVFSKAISTGSIVWALLYFTHSATRLVAPSFTFGLAAAQFELDDEEKKEGDRPARPNHRRR